MPNSKAAAKRIRSDAKKQARNQAALAELKTLSKKLWAMSSEPDKAATYAKKVVARYDHAVTHGVIPKGRADRKKSRIAGFLKRVGGAQTQTEAPKKAAPKKAAKKKAAAKKTAAAKKKASKKKA